MQRMSTAEAVVEMLLRHGIDTVYGVPGVHNDPFFDAIHSADGRMRMLHARHEQTAGYMALGAALATGRPQAFVVVPGPGLLNAVGGAAHRLWDGRAGDRAGGADPLLRDRPRARAPA